MNLFDAHLHIIDDRFPLIKNQGYLPPLFTVSDYLGQANQLQITGGTVVSGSFQGYDQSYLLDALEQLGPNFYGVTQLPPDVSEENIMRLHQKGVRAVRFNVKRGGKHVLADLDTLARKVFEVAGWHSELYIDARNLPEISKVLKELPAISIDHLGLSQEGLPHLLKLVEAGARVKATGFGRVDLNVADAILSIHRINPKALLFGTDLPSTRAKRPFQAGDIQLIQELVDDESQTNIFYQNALDWYATSPRLT